MKRTSRTLVILLLAAVVLPSCAKYPLTRSIYEGRRAQEQAYKDTPLGRSDGRSLSYDDYKKQRRALSKRGAATD
jgi:hypothetical protein